MRPDHSPRSSNALHPASRQHGHLPHKHNAQHGSDAHHHTPASGEHAAESELPEGIVYFHIVHQREESAVLDILRQSLAKLTPPPILSVDHVMYKGQALSLIGIENLGCYDEEYFYAVAAEQPKYGVLIDRSRITPENLQAHLPLMKADLDEMITLSQNRPTYEAYDEALRRLSQKLNCNVTIERLNERNDVVLASIPKEAVARSIEQTLKQIGLVQGKDFVCTNDAPDGVLSPRNFIVIIRHSAVTDKPEAADKLLQLSKQAALPANIRNAAGGATPGL